MFLLFVFFVLSLADVVLAQLYSPIDVDIEFTSTIDLSDTFHNSIAGPLAVVLVLAFTGILVAGLLQSSVSSTGRSTTDDNLESRFIFLLKDPSNKSIYQMFLNSWLYRVLSQMEAEKAFDFMGEMKDPCRRKILCHIHNFVPFTPPWLQTIFRVIRDEHSEKFRNIFQCF